MKLVSICMPCHNAAPYVAAALDSLFAQTWPNLEIIVVNDGSTDGSAEVLREYEHRGVKIVCEGCGSAAKARNRAFREATGDYIKFFDADDLLSQEMVEKQMNRLNGRRNAVASSEWGRFYGSDLSTYQKNPQSVWRDMKGVDWLVEAWKDARPMTQPGMFLIPREIIAKAGSWDEELTLVDDFEFFARILCNSEEVLFTPQATLFYRSGVEGSLSKSRSRQAAESNFYSLLRGTDQLLLRRDDFSAKRSCANMLQDLIYTFYPDYSNLRREMNRRVIELGGSDLEPDGPPQFQRLRRLVGWRIARRIQKLAGK